MSTFQNLYRNSYGLKSERADRFNGEPSWIETVIRECELGVRGPFHICAQYCDCISCCRLSWFREPYCRCKLGKQWLKSLTLDDAMRKKWLKCRCIPIYAPRPPGDCCDCLMSYPTQQYVWSPLPNDYDVGIPSPDDRRSLSSGELNEFCVKYVKEHMSWLIQDSVDIAGNDSVSEEERLANIPNGNSACGTGTSESAVDAFNSERARGKRDFEDTTSDTASSCNAVYSARKKEAPRFQGTSSGSGDALETQPTGVSRE